MAENLFVTIEGLALFRIGGDNQWKIYFPEAADHPFQLIIKNEKSKQTTTYVLPSKTRINFSPDDTKTEQGSREDSLRALELKSLAQFHRDYFNNEDNIPIKGVDTLENFAGILSLNGTKLGNLPFKEKPIDVWKVEKETINGKLVEKRTKEKTVSLGNKLVSKYEISDGKTAINITNNSVSFDITLDYGNQNTYSLLFKHNCEDIEVEGGRRIVATGCMEVSDFHHYYKILNTKNRIELNVEDKPEKRPNLICSPTGG
jgi:hypothetical protein